MHEIHISDVSLKELCAGKDTKLTLKEQLDIAKLLDALSVSVIEIEGISNTTVDTLRIKSLASAIKKSTLAVPVSLGAQDAQIISNALSECKNARLQVEAAVSPAQMEYFYGLKPNDMLTLVESSIKTCSKLCNNVEFVAQDITRTDIDYVEAILTIAIKAGAKIITLSDSTGSLLPSEFELFLDSLYKRVPMLTTRTVALNISNEYHLANACAIQSLKHGIREIKTSICLNSNISMENFVSTLKEKSSSLNVQCVINTLQINNISERIRALCFINEDSGALSSSGSIPDVNIELRSDDNKEAVYECVKALGYDLPLEDLSNIYKEFKRVTKRKETISSKELDAIVANTAMQVPACYTLINYVINSGNGIKATASIKLSKDDQTYESVALGKGPIDAAYQAIEKIVGSTFELEEFRIQAVTEGQKAIGDTFIKIISQGKVYSGRGLSADIISSAIHAYINAINKVVYEENK